MEQAARMGSMNTRAERCGNATPTLPDSLLRRPREDRAHLILRIPHVPGHLPLGPHLGDQGK